MRHKDLAATVDILVFTMGRNRGEILLIERKYEPFQGNWALPGGFMEADETFLQAAQRELEEETTIAGLALNSLGIFDTPGRDPRGRTISMAFWTIASGKKKLKASSDAARAAWFPVDELPPLAFDHDRIIAAGRQRIQELYQSATPLFSVPDNMKVKQLGKLLDLLGAGKK